MAQDRDRERPAGSGNDVAAERFALLLGERWRSAGDGIYVLVDAGRETAEADQVRSASAANSLKHVGRGERSDRGRTELRIDRRQVRRDRLIHVHRHSIDQVAAPLIGL